MWQKRTDRKNPPQARRGVRMNGKRGSDPKIRIYKIVGSVKGEIHKSFAGPG
jgi:hypothetical protein